jgi:hypothetical protein
VSEVKQTLKRRVVHTAREYLVISCYLFVVFSFFVLYKMVILAEVHIDFALHGFALFNALALGKVMLVAQELHLGDQFRDAPLIYPTLVVHESCLLVSKLSKTAPWRYFTARLFTQSYSLEHLGRGI